MSGTKRCLLISILVLCLKTTTLAQGRTQLIMLVAWVPALETIAAPIVRRWQEEVKRQSVEGVVDSFV
jgi:hypothetical protein